MPNFKFSYLYRDAGNYKNHNWIIFADPNNIPLSELEAFIQSKLIDGLWFVAKQWQMPDLHFPDWNQELDHHWHEFESLELTDEPANANFTLTQFMEVVCRSNPNY